MRDKVFLKAGYASRLLLNEDFKQWFDLVRNELLSRLETSRVTHNTQWEALEVLREYQGHMAFKQRLVNAMKAAEKKQDDKDNDPPERV